MYSYNVNKMRVIFYDFLLAKVQFEEKNRLGEELIKQGS